MYLIARINILDCQQNQQQKLLLSGQNNCYSDQNLSLTNDNTKKTMKSKETPSILEMATIRREYIKKVVNKLFLRQNKALEKLKCGKKRIISPQIVQNKQLKQYL